jgi:hypothetical protein
MVNRPRTRKNGNKPKPRNQRNNRTNVTSRQKMQVGSSGWNQRGSIHRPLIQKKFIEAGSDFLGPVTVRASPATTAERVLLAKSISPSAFPGTRLTQLSNLWERYRFRKFRLRWVPAVPKSVACQLVVYQDTDPLDDPTTITDPDALVRQATAQAGSQQFNFINPMSIELARRADDQLYYTGEDKANERFSRQGNFYVIQVTDPLNFNGEPLQADIMSGSMYVDWICEFQIAQINPSAIPSPFVPESQQEFTLFPADTSVPTTDTVTGVLLCTSDIQVALSRFNADFQAGIHSYIFSVNNIEVTRVSAPTLEIDFTQPPVIFPAGSYDVSHYGEGSNASVTKLPITFTVLSVTGSPVTYTPS